MIVLIGGKSDYFPLFSSDIIKYVNINDGLSKDSKIIDIEYESKVDQLILDLIHSGKISSCIDISKGGIYRALIRSCFNNQDDFMGSEIDIKMEEDLLLNFLFTEYQSTFLISCSKKDIDFISENAFHKENQIPLKIIGRTIKSNSIRINNLLLNREKLTKSFYY